MTEPDPGRFLADALSQASVGPVVVVVPAPLGDPLEVLRRVRRGEAWLLSRDGHEDEATEQVLGLGAACADVLSGPARLEVLEASLSDVSSWSVLAHPSAPSALVTRLPLRVAGLAFDVSFSDDEPWSAFGDGAVVLPRWTYLRVGDQAVLACATLERWPGQQAVVLGELEAIVSALEAPSRTPEPPPREVTRAASPGQAVWVDAIEAVRTAIVAGTLTKAVVARRTAHTMASDLAAEDIFAALPARGAMRYLVRRGGSCLVGATPERLFRKRGEKLSTEALAGTRCAAEPGAVHTDPETRLLESAKDLDEHVPVIAAIVSDLTALGARVTVESAPRIKRVANLVHLRTGIEADLPAGGSQRSAQILRALHPTPAVGGWPREAARSHIVSHEAPRGWYAGPIGWFDARGDADVHVALRCAVLRGARVWVFAGAGIVLGSDPLAEWEETAVKMRPLHDALGLAGEVSSETSPARHVSTESRRQEASP